MSSSTLWIFVEYVLPLLMLPVVARNRKPLPALGWAGFLFAFPPLSIPIYLVVGELGLREREGRHAERAPGAQQGTIEPDTLPEPARRIARTTASIAEVRGQPAPVQTADSIELFFDLDALDRLIEDIGNARDHVNLLFFMFAADETSWRLARALAEATSRGVEVRLLVDAHGSKPMRRKVKPWLEEHGVRVGKALKINPLQRPLRRFDVRNHRKIAVIDGRISYTGSMNIHDPDFKLDDGEWHQITARLEGAATTRLQAVFGEDWLFSCDERLEGERYYPTLEANPDGIPIQVIEDGPSYDRDLIQPVLAELFSCARERLVITTPYFVPDEPLLVALRLAALRGVEVDVIAPRQSDRAIADSAARANFEELLEVGVRIHLHRSGVLHAKTYTIDGDVGIVGTANFDYRSLFLNYEDGIVIYEPEIVKRLEEMQRSYLEDAETLELESWRRRRSTFDCVADDLARLTSPLL